ncbi:MAG: sensor histidine kinase [Burkholderiales bacterium]|nr:sensor histidine kinase [Burkholderiales bacterium]
MSTETNPYLEPVPAGGAKRAIGSLRQEHWLSLMLLALHGGLVMELTDPLARALLTTHFGLFLLWQPLWRGEQRLVLRQVVLILVAGVVLVAAGSWWLMALWISVLFSLIGGNMPGIRNVRQRVGAMLAALYLLLVLLMWVVPHLFEEQAFSGFVQAVDRDNLIKIYQYIAIYGLLIPAALIFFIRAEKTERQTVHALDLFYSVLLFLLVVVLVLGSFVIKQISHGNYVIALTQTLFGIALFLIVLSLLWDPRAGFVGIGQLVTRYFLSVGIPFEKWMHSLAGVAERVDDADKFAALAAEELAVLPWVSGVRWSVARGGGEVGDRTKHMTEFSFGGLGIAVYTRFTPSPALVLHIRLLARLLGDYYESKVRAAQQRRNAYMQAIYETGSRLTHDVKNLLQSLRSLCNAAETSGEADAESVRWLMRRQLPQIAQRLQITLDKLATDVSSGGEQSRALDWWESLKQRFAYEPVTFLGAELTAESDGMLHAELFDSVSDNLLRNALHKQRVSPELSIKIRLRECEGGYALTVCDDGGPVAESVAEHLFEAPVSSSKTGLGVGLYQASRFAKERSYRLRLVANVPGRVCFELAPMTEAQKNGES